MLEDVESGAAQFTRFQHAGQGILVDHLAARGVHDDGFLLHQFQAPRREQVIGGRRVRAIDRDDVHARQHLVKAFPVGGFEFLLDLRVHRLAVVIVDLQPEGLGPPCHGSPDAAHADDAEALAPDAAAEHPGGRPAGPAVVGADDLRTLDEAPCHRHDEGHGHVGGILGQNARRIGDRDAARQGGLDIDVVDASAEIGDQFQLIAGLVEDGLVDAVGDGWNQHLGRLRRLDQFGLAHGLVVCVETRVEQFHHPRLDNVGEFPRHHDEGFALAHSGPCLPKRSFTQS